MKKINLLRKKLEEEILFNTKEEETEMLGCADYYVEGGINTLGKNAFELSEESGIPVYTWNMFLSLSPVRNYISTTISSIIETNANKAIIEIMGEDIKASDVTRMKELQRIADDMKKQNNRQVYIVSRIPKKE